MERGPRTKGGGDDGLTPSLSQRGREHGGKTAAAAAAARATAAPLERSGTATASPDWEREIRGGGRRRPSCRESKSDPETRH